MKNWNYLSYGIYNNHSMLTFLPTLNYSALFGLLISFPIIILQVFGPCNFHY